VSRLLGVDFGTVRVGLAISDRDRRIASPLATYTRRSDQQDQEFFQRLVEMEEIGGLVVGLPFHCDGREGQKAAEARAYGQWLQKATGLSVTFWDERFTTVEAEGFLLEAGLTNKRRKQRRDRVAAQIMLQGYIDGGCSSQKNNAMIPREYDAMGLPKLKTPYTVSDYLKIERAATDRHMYLDGVIYAMAGESIKHGILSTNLTAVFHNQLKGTPCLALTKDTKVRSGPTLSAGETSRVLFSYPDLLVVCGEPVFLDANSDVILNPTAIAEVLSPSTEVFDRGEKFDRYQSWNPTLKDYLLVSQDKPQVEHFARNPDGGWSYHRHTGLESVVAIPSISCTLKLADIYDRVVFTEERLPDFD
jgi:putative transcription antitermination factor YqgF